MALGRVENASRMMAQYQRWRQASACGDCGTPVDRYSKCLRCRRQHAMWNVAYLRRRHAERG